MFSFLLSLKPGRQALYLLSPVVRVNDSGFFSFSSELLNLSTIAIFGLDSLFEKAYPCR